MIHPPVIIRLTAAQMISAGNIAIMRNVQNVMKGRKPRHGAELSWDYHVNGCFGELAASLFLNLGWSMRVGDTKERDVGGLIDVRAGSGENYRLVLHDDDPGNVPFINARTHDLPNVELVAWAYAEDGIRREWFEDPTGKNRWAYFVPNNADVLRPMSSLVEWVDFARGMTTAEVA